MVKAQPHAQDSSRPSRRRVLRPRRAALVALPAGLLLLTASTYAEETQDLNYFQQALQWAFEFCVCFFFDLVSPILERLLGAVPVETFDSADIVTAWASTIEGWVPMKLGLGLLIGFYTFLLVWIIIRYVFIPVPTVG
jgi:hypothetical protein